MNIIKSVKKLEKELNILGNIEVKLSVTSTKNYDNDIQVIEEKYDIVFPNMLKQLYINDMSKVILKWNTKGNTLGKGCKRGELNLLTPDEILNEVTDIQTIIEDSKVDTKELEKNEGLRALVNDWPFWIPIISFSNGDSFCIESRDKSLPIVFLEHDVMDGGPNLHGLRIASNFENLMENWSKVAFVDTFDWAEVVNEMGLDIMHSYFNELRMRISNL